VRGAYRLSSLLLSTGLLAGCPATEILDRLEAQGEALAKIEEGLGQVQQTLDANPRTRRGEPICTRCKMALPQLDMKKRSLTLELARDPAFDWSKATIDGVVLYGLREAERKWIASPGAVVFMPTLVDVSSTKGARFETTPLELLGVLDSDARFCAFNLRFRMKDGKTVYSCSARLDYDKKDCEAVELGTPYCTD